jgi:hypothetical protein
MDTGPGAGMLDEASRHATDGPLPEFTLAVEFSLTRKALDRCQALEEAGNRDKVGAILDDPANYDTGRATLTFAGREKSYNLSVAGFKKSITGKEQHTATFTLPARAA